MPNPLTKDEAIKLSTKRNGSFDLNTVFEKPVEMLNCETSEGKLMISRYPVQAFQCSRINGQWFAKDEGKMFAIFTMDGTHFPGPEYLHKNVKFPKDTV